MASLRASFEEAIDDYLALCDQKGIEPEKPFKGSFNVRVGSKMHRQAALFAQQRDSILLTYSPVKSEDRF